ncbi:MULTISPECIES: trypsin-like serine protease [Colwellia]|uniref:Serine protease n=1 Tax=Colwellia marinimaniae TaxID=1513592 RepID=A0ABQ0MXD7_9GAMM|nr:MULTISPECIES: trypsin-like serine protease [Colwellia]GAW97037.1 serine protease [Colwellia marinimaniae]
MKYFLCACLAFTALLVTANASNQSTVPIAKPKIVGGELANQGDWPWMAALVSTYSEVSTSLQVAGTGYDSSPFSNSPADQASATMVDCGIGDSQCSAASNKICLIARGDVDFSVKVDNCQAGGGIGAIIFNNTAGAINGTLGDNFSGSIPVIAISQDDGATLLNLLGSIASLNVTAQQKIVQSSSCGASFIGEKWLLTAAHCVEDANINLLKVNVGEYDLSNGAENAKAIKRIYIHPEYNKGSAFNNDIALIELIEAIDNPAVTLVDLDSSRQLALDNAAVTVIGWGNQTAYGPNDELPANDQPDKLRQVELNLLSNEQCKDKLAQAYTDLEGINYLPDQVGITDSMICANHVGGGKGSCQGDSGGPLLVNTNQGWQQIGIVSYGIGCANAEFPGVYARVGQFTDWINNISKGIAIEPTYDFAITPQHTAQTTQLTVSNNSELTANLTFTLVIDKIGSTGFSLTPNSCNTLVAKQKCTITLAFDAKTLGQHKMRIIINSNDDNIPTSQSFISAQAIAANNVINTQLSSGSTELLWFSGGDKPWLLDNSEAAISSGEISDNQQSSVMLTFTGAGSLSFYWSVSSEENTEDPSSPYDALYLIIDGEKVDFISGEVPYAKVTIPNLAEGKHQITWLYLKDGATSNGEDKAYLKEVVFTPETAPADTSATSPPPVQTASKSSGGSVTYLLLLLTLLPFKRRRS